jgi:hypothetical protein
MGDRGKPEDIWVAFSFAGKERARVEAIATALEKRLGRGRVFYDVWFEAALNGTDFAEKLEHTYQQTAALIVPCLSADYRTRFWTKAERAAITNRRIRFAQESPGQYEDWLFLLRVGEGQVPGFGDSMLYSPAQEPRAIEEIVELIIARLLMVDPAFRNKIAVLENPELGGLNGHQIDTLVSALIPYQQALEAAWLASLHRRLTLSEPALSKTNPLPDLLIHLLDQSTTTQLTCVEILRRRLLLDGHAATEISNWLANLPNTFAEVLEQASKRAAIEMLLLQKPPHTAEPATRIQVIINVDDHAKEYTVFLAAPDQATATGVLCGGKAGRVTELSKIPTLFAAEFEALSRNFHYDHQTKFEFIAPLELLTEGLNAWVFNRAKRTVPICLNYVSYLRSYELKYVDAYSACHNDATRLWQAHCAGTSLCDWHIQHDVHELKAITPWNPTAAICMTGFTPGPGAKLLFDELIHCGTPIALCLSAKGNHCATLAQSIRLQPHAQWPHWVFNHHRDVANRTVACDAITLYYDNPNDQVPLLPGRNNNGRLYVPTLRKTP